MLMILQTTEKHIWVHGRKEQYVKCNFLLKYRHTLGILAAQFQTPLVKQIHGELCIFVFHESDAYTVLQPIE